MTEQRERRLGVGHLRIGELLRHVSQQSTDGSSLEACIGGLLQTADRSGLLNHEVLVRSAQQALRERRGLPQLQLAARRPAIKQDAGQEGGYAELVALVQALETSTKDCKPALAALLLHLATHDGQMLEPAA